MSDCKGWPVLRHAVLSEHLYIKDYKKKRGTIHLFSSQLCRFFFPDSLLASANSGQRSDIQKGLPFSTTQVKRVIKLFPPERWEVVANQPEGQCFLLE